MVPALYPFAVVASLVFRIVQVLVYAALGLLFASWCRCTRTYLQLLRLAVVAVTPCIIVKTILTAAGIGIPFDALWYFLAAMGFLFFGIKATCEETTSQPRPAETPAGGTPGKS